MIKKGNVDIFYRIKRHGIQTKEDENEELSYEGILSSVGDSTYISYESVNPEDGEKTSNRIKIKGNILERQTLGEARSVITFEKGRETTTNYITPYGTFPMRFLTSHLEIVEQSDEIKMCVEYVLTVDNEPTYDCVMEIIVKAK